MFQSHLRLIHPIHSLAISFRLSRESVSIASAPHPPYPLPHMDIPVAVRANVSIASAPHPPYPLHCSASLWINTLPVSIASAPHPPYPQSSKPALSIWFETFQSHLRLIHPIHATIAWSDTGGTMFQSHLRLIHPIHDG